MIISTNEEKFILLSSFSFKNVCKFIKYRILFSKSNDKLMLNHTIWLNNKLYIVTFIKIEYLYRIYYAIVLKVLNIYQFRNLTENVFKKKVNILRFFLEYN